MSEARHSYCVGVVGDGSVMTADELGRVLDYLVNRRAGECRIVLLSLGGCPAHDWARDRGHSTHLVAEDNAVKTCCSLVASADAVVILGDPEPWRKLAGLCADAGVKVRNYRRRPKSIPASVPAWVLSEPDPAFTPG